MWTSAWQASIPENTCIWHTRISFLFNGDEAVFDREYRRLCREVKKRNIPLEINFLGLMEERWYPNEKFWKIAGEEGNTAVFGCDAHTSKAVWNPETEQKHCSWQQNTV